MGDSGQSLQEGLSPFLSTPINTEYLKDIQQWMYAQDFNTTALFSLNNNTYISLVFWKPFAVFIPYNIFLLPLRLSNQSISIHFGSTLFRVSTVLSVLY